MKLLFVHGNAIEFWSFLCMATTSVAHYLGGHLAVVPYEDKERHETPIILSAHAGQSC